MASKLPNLTTITKSFGRAYESADKANARKTKAQAKFFAAIDKVLETQVRKQQLVDVAELSEGDTFESFIARYYPGWRLVSINDSGEQAVIEEDPTAMKYSFVNKEDGMVYARTVAQSGTSLDDERLRQENPNLWEQITEWPEPWFSLIYEFSILLESGYDSEMIKEALDTYLSDKGMQRILKNPEDWTDAEFRAVSKYMVPGPVSTRLVKPRKATDEELA